MVPHLFTECKCLQRSCLRKPKQNVSLACLICWEQENKESNAQFFPRDSSSEGKGRVGIGLGGLTILPHLSNGVTVGEALIGKCMREQISNSRTRKTKGENCGEVDSSSSKVSFQE